MSDNRLETEVLADLRRSARWERAHEGFIVIVGYLLLGGALVFGAYREWLIWTR